MAETTPSFAQDLLWRLEALAFDIFTGVSRLFPVDAVSDFGAWLFGTLGPLTSSHHVAETNLRIAFPEASDAEIETLLAEQWRQTGRFFAEFPIIDRIVKEPGRLEVVGRERLEAIARAGGPAVLVSGHFSTIEVMAAAIVGAGVRCEVSYRAANNPYVNRRIREGRARYGVDRLAPKGTEGARALMRALVKGDAVALLNDQKANDGIAVPFFGVDAYTAPGPAAFALRFKVPVVPMSVQRRHKSRFTVFVHEPIVLEETGDRAADVEAGTRRITAFIEERIRARPTEWFWVHKRWPKELYKKALSKAAGAPVA